MPYQSIVDPYIEGQTAAQNALIRRGQIDQGNALTQARANEEKQKAMIQAASYLAGPAQEFDRVYTEALKQTGDDAEAARAMVQPHYQRYIQRLDRQHLQNVGITVDDNFDPLQNRLFLQQVSSLKKSGGVYKRHMTPTSQGIADYTDEPGSPVTWLKAPPESDKGMLALPPTADVGLATAKRIGGAEQEAEKKEAGKYFGEAFGKMLSAAESARSKVNDLDQMEEYLNSVSTGKSAAQTGTIAAWAKGLFGVELDQKMPYKQALDALSKKMALQLRNPSGGAGMPGAMSDQDREYLSKMVVSLGNDPITNKMILDAMRKVENRQIQVSDMALDYRAQHGKLDEGFYSQIRQWSKQNPMFPKLGKRGATPVPVAAPAPAPAQGQAGRFTIQEVK